MKDDLKDFGIHPAIIEIFRSALQEFSEKSFQSKILMLVVRDVSPAAKDMQYEEIHRRLSVSAVDASGAGVGQSSIQQVDRNYIFKPIFVKKKSIKESGLSPFIVVTQAELTELKNKHPNLEYVQARYSREHFNYLASLNYIFDIKENDKGEIEFADRFSKDGIRYVAVPDENGELNIFLIKNDSEGNEIREPAQVLGISIDNKHLPIISDIDLLTVGGEHWSEEESYNTADPTQRQNLAAALEIDVEEIPETMGHITPNTYRLITLINQKCGLINGIEAIIQHADVGGYDDSHTLPHSPVGVTRDVSLAPQPLTEQQNALTEELANLNIFSELTINVSRGLNENSIRPSASVAPEFDPDATPPAIFVKVQNEMLALISTKTCLLLEGKNEFFAARHRLKESHFKFNSHPSWEINTNDVGVFELTEALEKALSGFTQIVTSKALVSSSQRFSFWNCFSCFSPSRVWPEESPEVDAEEEAKNDENFWSKLFCC